MRIGKLDRRVLIERPVETQNEFGEPVKTWVTVATVWAEVTPLSGRELFAAQQIVPEASLRIRIRYRSDIDETMRITHDGKVYGVQHIAEIGRRDGLEILVREPE